MLDIVIQNGMVFNSIKAEFERKSIGIRDGVFVSAKSDAESKEKIDASGKYVLPGLIDEHAHWNLYGSMIGANADMACIPGGVTTTCDGGTCGASNFEQFYQSNIIRYETTVYSYLNISTFGNKSQCIHEENHDPRDFRADLIEAMFQKHSNILRGLKIRMCRATLENYGMQPLEAGLDISERLKSKGYFCPVVLHYGDLPENVKVKELFSALRPGDIVAHVFQTKGETIFQKNGSIKECIWNAKNRGVYLDDCHGRIHWSFPNLQNAFEKGLFPDIISSDLVRISEYVRPGFSLVYAMAVNSAAGMPLEKILQSVTWNPAKAMGIEKKAGVIREGRSADVAVMDIVDTKCQFEDSYGNLREGNKLFIPLMTIKNGRVAYRQVYF